MNGYATGGTLGFVRLSGRIRLRAFGIAPEEASFERRGFAQGAAAQGRLEQVGRTFVGGYRLALEEDDAHALAARLDLVDGELAGFAYEGAAMGIALRDALAPWRPGRLAAFLAGTGAPHRYMVHVGAGWAFARLRRGPRAIRRMDPLLRWLALDGYGFHEGYFGPARAIHAGRRPRGFDGYAGRAFDQGLGRSLWFVDAGLPGLIEADVGRLAPSRRGDVWSGVALAAAYAGGAGEETLGRLAAAAAGYAGHLAQGAAFAAAARAHAGNPAAHTELACRALAGVPAAEAARLTDAAAEGLPPDGAEPAYEVWRRRLRDALGDAAPESRLALGRSA